QPTGFPGLKNVVLGKRSEEVAETLNEGIAKNPAARETVSQSELKHVSAGKTIQQASAVAGVPRRILTAPTEAEATETTPQVEEADENILPHLTPVIASTTGTVIKEPATSLDVADAGRNLNVNVGPLLVSRDRPVMQEEIEAPGETKEAAPAKKAAKVQ